MRRTLKLGLVLGFVGLAAVASLPYVLSYFPRTVLSFVKVKGRLDAGSLSLGWFSLSAKDIRLSQPDQELVRIGQVGMEKGLFALLFSRSNLGHITVDDCQVKAHIRADKSTDIEEALSDEDPASGLSKAGRTTFSLELRHATVVLIDASEAGKVREHSVKQIALDLDVAPSGYSISGKASYEESLVDFAAQSEAGVLSAKVQNLPTAPLLALSGLSNAFEDQILSAIGPRLQLDLAKDELTVSSDKAVSKWRLGVDSCELLAPFSLRSQTSLGQLALQLDAFLYQGGKLTGKGTLSGDAACLASEMGGQKYLGTRFSLVCQGEAGRLEGSLSSDSLTVEKFAFELGKAFSASKILFGKELVAENFSVAMQRDAQNLLTASLTSSAANGTLKGFCEDAGVRLVEPFVGDVRFSSSALNYLMCQGDVREATKRPFSLETLAPLKVDIAAAGSFLTADLSSLSLGEVQVAENQMRVGLPRSSNTLVAALQALFNMSINLGTDRTDVWFLPFKASFQQHTVQLGRMDMRLAGKYDIIVWGSGTADNMRVTVAIPAKALRQALNIKGLKDEAVLQVPFTGPLGLLKCDVQRVTALLMPYVLGVWTSGLLTSPEDLPIPPQQHSFPADS